MKKSKYMAKGGGMKKSKYMAKGGAMKGTKYMAMGGAMKSEVKAMPGVKKMPQSVINALEGVAVGAGGAGAAKVAKKGLHKGTRKRLKGLFQRKKVSGKGKRAR
jgi:hypothetical protein